MKGGDKGNLSVIVRLYNAESRVAYTGYDCTEINGSVQIVLHELCPTVNCVLPSGNLHFTTGSIRASMNPFTPLTQTVYREVSERAWTIKEEDIDAAYIDSQIDSSNEIYVTPVGRFRRCLGRMRPSKFLVLGIIALCGILAGISWIQGFWHFFGASANKIESASPPQNEPSSDHGIEIPLVLSPAFTLLNGLKPLENNDPYTGIRTKLGWGAEQSYTLGPRTLEAYRASLVAFIDLAMPADLQPALHSALTRYTDNGNNTIYLKDTLTRLLGVGEDPKTEVIWQTNSTSLDDKDVPAASWNMTGEGWDRRLINSLDGSTYVRENFSSSRVKDLWHLLPNDWLVSNSAPMLST